MHHGCTAVSLDRANQLPSTSEIGLESVWQAEFNNVTSEKSYCTTQSLSQKNRTPKFFRRFLSNRLGF